jgi:hypothetical protein
VQLDVLQRTEATTPFDLTAGRLLRARLVWLAKQEYVLLVTLHHIASDGWSIALLARELGAIYSGIVQRDAVALPALPIQYPDFAVWQRQWLQGPVLDAQLAYWQDALAGAPTTELPLDSPRPSTPTFQTAVATMRIDPPLQRRLQQLSSQAGVTMFMTLLTALTVLLSRYSGQDDIVIGTSVAGRTRRETEGLIGFFLNMLVLRLRVAANATVRELLAHAREVALGAYAHQDVPFDRVVEAVQPDRDADYSPLFRILFAVQNVPTASPEMAGLTVSPYEIPTAGSKYDITLTAVESVDGIACALQYNADLFTADTIERLLGNLRVLLNSMTADPDGQVLDLPMISETELQQLSQWSQQ